MEKHWSIHTGWQPTEPLSLDQLLIDREYSALSYNCFQSVDRIWSRLVPSVEFDILYDPLMGPRVKIPLEDHILIFGERVKYLTPSELRLLTFKKYQT
mmetsp:Transcript_26504/g.19859  ORF Transcript_26504/g.19859 Transcript_26504/m.19859 type:complete len:98 (+) Transcript_26504:323-616(+)